MWINPKLDWIEDDYFNLEDFNRVENNTLEVANFLSAIQYTISLESSITNRTTGSIDFISSINRIERNIDAIKTNFITPLGWQDKKIWSVGIGCNYLDARRWENNLTLLYDWAIKAKDSLRYCGTFSCGEEVIFSA